MKDHIIIWNNSYLLSGGLTDFAKNREKNAKNILQYSHDD